MRNTFSDKDLVGQVLSGRTDAYAQLVERHIRGAHAIAYARVGNVPDAEDAVQEAFLRALEKLRSLRDPAKFGSWLLTIARHEAVRLSTERARSTSDSTPADTAHTPDAGAREMNALVREQVLRLPDQHREILLLHYFAGRTTREIAELLDLRQGAVLKRLQRAREQLTETLLHDLETAKPSPPAVAKRIAHIAALASTLPIAATQASAAGVATSASGLSFLFPKAGTIAAALAGMGFMAAIGWTYLDRRAPNPVDAARVEASAPTSAATVVIDAPAPMPVEAPISVPATEPVQVAQADSTSAPAETAAPRRFPNASGTWDVSMFLAGTHEEHLGNVTITDLGAILHIFPDDNELGPFFLDCRRVGNRIELTMNDPDATGKLTGAFNEAITELNLSGNIETGSEDESVSMDVKLVAQRVDAGQPSRADQVAQLRRLMEDFNAKLDQFVANTGAYPRTMEELRPNYIADLTPLASTETRTVKYSPPTASDDNAIRQLTAAAMTASTAQELMSIEESLVAHWNFRFMDATAMLDVKDTNLNIHLRLRTKGRIDEVVDTAAIVENPSPSAKLMREEALRASCANNIKQLNLVFRMFQGAQQHGLSPTGWRMTYPAYMADTRILTNPAASFGTESYEILFPGATREWLMNLAQRIGGISAEDTSAQLAAVPIIIETEPCVSHDGHHVVFLDGHAEFRKGALEDHADLAPYLAQR